MRGKGLEIYKTIGGGVVFDADREGETIWATRILKNYVTKGIVVNERRLKELPAVAEKGVDCGAGV
ncbi:hypothetical protein IJI55_02860 [Candidatus Saccharibacteria bacterium]|nr:hypothetical protein [Candidatus Saccharibacteria bacterium]